MINLGTSCWYWAGSQKESGYGSVWNGVKNLRAHRAIYEALIGDIPEGLVLDHLCQNKICVNPEHLEAVTQKENMRRFDYSTRKIKLKTHCKKGHLFSDRIRPDRNVRLCLICVSQQNKAYKLRRKLKGTEAIIK